MSKNYELFTGNDLKIAELILRRRLQILIHSCLYYEMDSSIISDRQWDVWARELLSLQQKYPDISSTVDWADAFATWDASTGAFLPLRHPWVTEKAKYILDLHRKRQKDG